MLGTSKTDNWPRLIFREPPRLAERFTRTLATTVSTVQRLAIHGVGRIHRRTEKQAASLSLMEELSASRKETRRPAETPEGATIFISPYCRCSLPNHGQERERNGKEKKGSLSADDSLRDPPGIPFAANVPSSPFAEAFFLLESSSDFNAGGNPRLRRFEERFCVSPTRCRVSFHPTLLPPAPFIRFLPVAFLLFFTPSQRQMLLTAPS